MRDLAGVLFRYLKSKSDQILDGVTEELSQNRAILNWVYCASYLAMAWYSILNYPESVDVCIMTTGTLVGAIFASYVFGASYEKATEIKYGSKPPEPATSWDSENEEGAGD
jgi:hypothetical protein